MFYHEGSRRLQDLFDSRRLADRVEERDLHRDLRDWERDFVESAPMFFLATADDPASRSAGAGGRDARSVRKRP
jgi:hypothetical protein